MNDQALQGRVEKISSEDFGRKFKHRAFFNGRLRTTGGRYRLKDHDIEINPKMLTEHGSNVLIGIIKHELCHYHLHLEGKGYKHKDPEFKALLKKVDGLRYAPESKSEKPGVERFYIYECEKCGMLYQRKRRVNTARFVCSKCRGSIKLVEIREYR